MLSERIRVVMIISLFYPFLGGAEQQAYQLAKKLIRRGVGVTVLTRAFSHLPSCEELEGVIVYRKIKTVEWRMLFGITYLFSVLLFLLSHRNEYDIIHCHQLQGFHTLAAVWCKWLLRKRVMVKVSSTGITSDFGSLLRIKGGRMLLRWAQRVDKIIALCTQSSEEAVAHGFTSEKIVQLPNGVDLDYFSPRVPQGNHRIKILTFIGRLDAFKGVDVLLRAFQELCKERPQLQLRIIGEGPERGALEEMSHRLGIAASVIFEGEHKEVREIYRHTDVVVLPSFSEGLSNVLLEAMACGLPAVATAVGGNRDLIKDGYNGILIPPGDEGRLCEALRELMEKEHLARRLSGEARKTVEQYYAMDQIVERYVALYRQLVS